MLSLEIFSYYNANSCIYLVKTLKYNRILRMRDFQYYKITSDVYEEKKQLAKTMARVRTQLLCYAFCALYKEKIPYYY